jgi:hypothetical protein
MGLLSGKPEPEPESKQPTTREINDYLRSATKPNSPNRMLDGWSMPIADAVWYLNPVGGPTVELYRHEIVEYVGMLRAAGVEPAPISNWRAHQ